MQEFRMIIVGIEEEIISCLKETNSFNRIKALLTIASVHISIIGSNLNKYILLSKENSTENPLNKIDSEINDFVESIFTILKIKAEENENIIPQKELLNFALSVNSFQMHCNNICLKDDKASENSSCNIKIRRKSKFGINSLNSDVASNDEENNENDDDNEKSSLEKNISFIDQFCNLYVFPDCLTLHLKISPRIKFTESINDIILYSNHPSFILQSIRALRCLVVVGETTTIRFHISDYLAKFHQLQSIYPVSYYVSYLLVDIVGGSGQFISQSSILLSDIDSSNNSTNSIIESEQIIDISNKNPTENSNKVMHSSPNLLSSVATNSAVLSSIRNTITSELFPLILVPISRASFYPLAKVIVALVDTETNPKAKYYMRLINECEKIIEDGITSFLNFKLYLEILTARIRKIPGKEKEKVAKDSVIKLIRIFTNGVSMINVLGNVKNSKNKNVAITKGPSTFDSYFIDDYLNVLLKLMNEFLSYDEMIMHFVLTVLPSVPRFFPSFVTIAKILKQAKNKSESYNNCIIKAEKLLNERQSKALDMILKGKMTNEILKLSEGTVETIPI